MPFWALLAFYGATVFLSLLVSDVPMATLFVCWQFFRVFLLFVAVAGECDRPDMRNGLLVGLSAGLVVQACYVVQQKLNGVIQATGSLAHQNTLGMMVLLALTPLIAATMVGRQRFAVIGILAALIVIAGGGSRAAGGFAIASILALIILSLVRYATVTKWKVVGAGVVGIAVIVPLGLTTLSARFGTGSMITQEEGRLSFERAARLVAADHPFGVGSNMYVPTANSKGYAAQAGVAWNFANRSAPVHNAYLLARAEMGWIGEFALILLLIIPTFRGLFFAFAKRRGAGGEIALGSAVAVGFNIAHNLYEFAVLTYPVQALLMINIALISAELRRSRDPSRLPVGKKGRSAVPETISSS